MLAVKWHLGDLHHELLISIKMTRVLAFWDTEIFISIKFISIGTYFLALCRGNCYMDHWIEPLASLQTGVLSSPKHYDYRWTSRNACMSSWRYKFFSQLWCLFHYISHGLLEMKVVKCPGSSTARDYFVRRDKLFDACLEISCKGLLVVG